MGVFENREDCIEERVENRRNRIGSRENRVENGE
jgi:hypothetical protein